MILIRNFETVDFQLYIFLHRDFQRISMPQLNEFHLKASRPDLPTLDAFTSMLKNVSHLQRVKYRLCLGDRRNEQNWAADLNGQNWHRISTYLKHLVDFDCSMWCYMKSNNHHDDVHACLQIVRSFSEFTDWSVDVGRAGDNAVYICLYTKTRRLLGVSVDIDPSTLMRLNGREMTTLIDGVSNLDFDMPYTHHVDEDEGDDGQSPPLTLLAHTFPHLRTAVLGAYDFINFTDRWESFLKQLFHRAFNLNSIEVHSSGDGNGPYDIEHVLECFEIPSMCVQRFEIRVRGDFNQSLLEKLAFHLPKLMVLSIDRIYDEDTIVLIVNACLTHLKHMVYFTFDYFGLNSSTFYEDRSDRFKKDETTHLWLKQNTLLGDSVLGREFFLAHDDWPYIWL
jgi:hypothetical protein